MGNGFEREAGELDLIWGVGEKFNNQGVNGSNIGRSLVLDVRSFLSKNEVYYLGLSHHCGYGPIPVN